MNNNTKIAGVEFTPDEVEKLKFKIAQGDDYIIRYRTIYHLYFEKEAIKSKVYARKNGGLPYVRRGRFIISNAADVNDLLNI